MPTNTNTHEIFAEKISQWLDNELAAPDVTDLEAHLADCSQCRQSYQQLLAADRRLQSAATVMTAPPAGFTHRFESRLALYRPRQLWQIWLVIVALAVGASLILGSLVVSGGLALVNTASTTVNVSLLSQTSFSLIESAETVQFLAGLAGLLIKSSIITMQQPLFWAGLTVAMLLVLFWAWLMRTILQQNITAVDSLVL